MLIGEGYQVVHLSRHGSFEEGKDVLAIAPDGVPCAFQLKGANGGKISQNEWSKYNEQITRLVEIPIKHPSIDESKVGVFILSRMENWMKKFEFRLQTKILTGYADNYPS